MAILGRRGGQFRAAGAHESEFTRGSQPQWDLGAIKRRNIFGRANERTLRACVGWKVSRFFRNCLVYMLDKALSLVTFPHGFSPNHWICACTPLPPLPSSTSSTIRPGEMLYIAKTNSPRPSDGA